MFADAYTDNGMIAINTPSKKELKTPRLNQPKSSLLYILANPSA
jgi:hypothetical protein